MRSEPISGCDDVLDECVPAFFEVYPFLGAEGETQFTLLVSAICGRARVSDEPRDYVRM